MTTYEECMKYNLVASLMPHQSSCPIRPHACNFIKKETLAQVLSWEFCEIFQSTFFMENLWWLLLWIWPPKFWGYTSLRVTLILHIISSLISCWAALKRNKENNIKYFFLKKLPSKSKDWFLYDNGLRHEKVKRNHQRNFGL